ncbi:hypothetical protein GEO21_20925 [Sphingobacterium faecium]|uniref:hypothetical protein n=1 Tax=Sphingobacterium faecium TaxID=34087 RepID=UPI00129285A4|nr:hypothetical protein [Sphingobacterium faecium]MQP29954.1 hypothetical protein [Sphingobacterium faecium]
MVTVRREIFRSLASVIGKAGLIGLTAKAGWDAGDLISKNIGSITSGIATGLVKLGFDPNKLYAPDILNNYTLNSGTKTIDDLTKNAKKTRTTGTGIDEYEKDGAMDQANKDYDDLVVLGSSKPIPIGRIGKTADVKLINVRSKSSPRHESPGIPGTPSLEIYNPNTQKSEKKIRYPK